MLTLFVKKNSTWAPNEQAKQFQIFLFRKDIREKRASAKSLTIRKLFNRISSRNENVRETVHESNKKKLLQKSLHF